MVGRAQAVKHNRKRYGSLCILVLETGVPKAHKDSLELGAQASCVQELTRDEEPRVCSSRMALAFQSPEAGAALCTGPGSQEH